MLTFLPSFSGAKVSPGNRGAGASTEMGGMAEGQWTVMSTIPGGHCGSVAWCLLGTEILGHHSPMVMGNFLRSNTSESRDGLDWPEC